MHSGSSALLTIGSDFEKREDGIDRLRFARPTGSIETGMLCDAFGDLDTGAHGRAAAAKAAEDQRQAHFPRLVDGKGNAIPLTQEFLGQMLGVRRTTSLKPRKNASTDGAHSLAVALPRTPITRVVACCARRASLRIFVVQCSLPCDPPVGGHSCPGEMIPRLGPLITSRAAAKRTFRHFASSRSGRSSSYSITRSARASKASGITMPSALAVCILIDNSISVGCSTGMSAGFAPSSTFSRKWRHVGSCPVGRGRTQPTRRHR
jgi:hypothetical protein